MKGLLIASVAALALVAAATPADASCNPGKFAKTYNFGTAVYVYIDQGDGSADPAALVGQFWQGGLATSANSGTYSDDLWLFQDVGGLISMNAELGTDGVNGCPAGNLVAVVETTSPAGAKFVAMTANESASGSGNENDFDYAVEGVTYSMINIPRVLVENSSRGAGTVTLNVRVPSTSAGAYGPQASTIISGYQIVNFGGTADPGRNASAWTALQTIPAAGGAEAPASVTVDCSNTAVDRFVAVRLQFDNGTVSSKLVGPSVRVECDPTLADPDKEFKLIDGPKQKPRPARER
jgi:hypothetical protein